MKGIIFFRHRLWAVSIILYAFLASAISCKNPQVIAIQPYGNIKTEYIEYVVKKIEAFYGFKVVILEQKPIPEDAYYKPGKRYDASKIIRRLKKQYKNKYDKIIALTEHDIYHKKGKIKYKGIVGLGLVHGRTAIISINRLKKYDNPSKEKLLKRFTKSVIHEIGHTYGLKHCTRTHYCIMQGARGHIKNIDKKELRFCPYCKDKILGNLQ